MYTVPVNKAALLLISGHILL